MRRNDRAVTDPVEIVDIMSRCEVLHLAIAAEPAPYLLPVNFGMEPDGRSLYVHGAMEGTKYDLLTKTIVSALRWNARMGWCWTRRATAAP